MTEDSIDPGVRPQGNKKDKRKGSSDQNRKRGRILRKRVLIVGEGDTEKAYFDDLKKTLTKDITIDVKAVGKDPHKLVKKARALKAKAERKNQPFDEVWLVFDRDRVPQSTLEQVMADAKAEGFGIAYSNPKVELWLLLHYQDMTAALSGAVIEQKLKQHLPEYEKDEQSLKDLYQRLNQTGDEEAAIERAEKMDQDVDLTQDYEVNPYTSVYRLVQRLIQYRSD